MIDRRALETVRLHLRELLVTTMPDEFKVPLRKALERNHRRNLTAV